MQFTQVLAIAVAAVSVSAAPVAEAEIVARTAPSCTGGSVYCKQDNSWSKATQTCTAGSTYCCITEALVSVADCTNILSGNTIKVPISLLPGLTINLKE